MKAVAELPHVPSDQLTQAVCSHSMGDVVTYMVGFFVVAHLK